MNKCPVCGESDGCSPTKGLVADSPLTKEDWRKIYEFMKYIYYPFIHRIIANARARKKNGND
jgi:hypothetical protein